MPAPLLALMAALQSAPPPPPPAPAAHAMTAPRARLAHFHVPRPPRPPRLPRELRDGPGPDSIAVARLLGALAQTPPGVCGMAVSMLGNGWDGGARSVVNALGDEPASARRAFESPLRDRRAVPLLAAALSRPEPCVRRAAARLLGNSELAESGKA